MKKTFVIISLLFLVVSGVLAEIPERPNPPQLVNDFANILSSGERAELEDSLVQFARATSTQIVVVTVSDLEGYDPGDYAFRLGEKWGVGQKDRNNGIVVLVKPKQGNSKGQVFIATGYGLEGVLPDAVVNSTVVDYEMTPWFKQNNYFRGIMNGVQVIMKVTRGEYTADQYQQQYAGKKGDGFIPALIIFILVFVFVFRGRSRRYYSPGKSLPFWLAMGLLSGGGRSSGGSFGNFSSGGGSFGGFGGFGGGSFGGGGAGGSW